MKLDLTTIQSKHPCFKEIYLLLTFPKEEMEMLISVTFFEKRFPTAKRKASNIENNKPASEIHSFHFNIYLPSVDGSSPILASQQVGNRQPSNEQKTIYFSNEIQTRMMFFSPKCNA